jgi:hypothetical protein
VSEDAGSRRWRTVVIVLVVLLIVGGGVATWAALRSSTTPPGPEGVIVLRVPNLAPASTTLDGQPVDGITCRQIDHAVVNYHVHAYVTVFVNGSRRRIPAGVGITRPFVVERLPSGIFIDGGVANCLYWLHTHAYDGIVHVEAPKKGTFTLGQFFAIWNQPLTTSQVGPAKGPVVVFENGRQLTGSPGTALLSDHAVIQIDVGTPVVPFRPFVFRVTGSCGQSSKGCKPKSG